MTGLTSSTTVTFAVQVLALLAASSLVLHAALPIWPTGVPEVGLCVIVSALLAVQLSPATISPVRSGIAGWQLAPDETVGLLAHVAMTGLTSSTTVTFAVQVLALLAASLTVMVTVVS